METSKIKKRVPINHKASISRHAGEIFVLRKYIWTFLKISNDLVVASIIEKVKKV